MHAFHANRMKNNDSANNHSIVIGSIPGMCGLLAAIALVVLHDCNHISEWQPPLARSPCDQIAVRAPGMPAAR